MVMTQTIPILTVTLVRMWYQRKDLYAMVQNNVSLLGVGANFDLRGLYFFHIYVLNDLRPRYNRLYPKQT